MARLTIDASIAIKFLIDEAGSSSARRFFPKLTEHGYEPLHILTAPALMLIELHYVLAKKIRLEQVRKTAFSEAYPRLKRFIEFAAVDLDMIEEARSIAMVAKALSVGATPIYPSDFSIFNIYDCIYVAHARRSNSTLVTADAELARIARDGFSIPVEFIDVIKTS